MIAYWCSFEAGLSEFLGNLVGSKYCWFMNGTLACCGRTSG